jgi:hypothetical protein
MIRGFKLVLWTLAPLVRRHIGTTHFSNLATGTSRPESRCAALLFDGAAAGT